MSNRSPSVVRLALLLPALAIACTIDAGLEFDGQEGGIDEAGDVGGPGSDDGAGEGDDSFGDGDGDGDGDGTPGDGDGDGDGTPSCEEPWSTPFVGAPCGHDDDCHDGGFCLLPEDGFPCGTCTEPCEEFCPDLDGAPTTFCVVPEDVGTVGEAGLCLSQCDANLFPEGGCREGYTCAGLARYPGSGTIKGTCVPDAVAPEPDPGADCLPLLAATGAVFTATEVPVDQPEGHPDLDCILDQPVWLYPPLNDVTWSSVSSDSESPVLVSCEMALAMVEATAIMRDRGTIEFEHWGTYNCRVISGTDTLSAHGLAAAIDLVGFLTEDDAYYTVFDDWEDGVPAPTTAGGAFLKGLTDAWFDAGVFNIILTPEYNDAHDDHFHVDLTPGSSFYE